MLLPGSKARQECAVTSSSDLWGLYAPVFADEQQEMFLAVGLTAKNKPMREHIVAIGSCTEVRVDPRDVFREMLKCGAARMVVLHNHPSGDPTPSPDDVAITRRLLDGAEILGLSILDHVVISSDGRYSSLRDLGLMSDGETK